MPAEHLPPAYGFINGIGMKREPALKRKQTPPSWGCRLVQPRPTSPLLSLTNQWGSLTRAEPKLSPLPAGMDAFTLHAYLAGRPCSCLRILPGTDWVHLFGDRKKDEFCGAAAVRVGGTRRPVCRSQLPSWRDGQPGAKLFAIVGCHMGLRADSSIRNGNFASRLFKETTLREVVHLSVGGSRLRIKLSNAFGDQPLLVRSVHIARPAPGSAPGSVDPATDQPLSFNGKPVVAVPAGAEYVSDPVTFTAAPLSDLVVTMLIGSAPAVPTLHAGAHETAFLVRRDHVTDAQLNSPQTFTRWYFLAGVEVEDESLEFTTRLGIQHMVDGDRAGLSIFDKSLWRHSRMEPSFCAQADMSKSTRHVTRLSPW